jgi:hypothetical protein
MKAIIFTLLALLFLFSMTEALSCGECVQNWKILVHLNSPVSGKALKKCAGICKKEKQADALSERADRLAGLLTEYRVKSS